MRIWRCACRRSRLRDRRGSRYPARARRRVLQPKCSLSQRSQRRRTRQPSASPAPRSGRVDSTHQRSPPRRTEGAAL